MIPWVAVFVGAGVYGGVEAAERGPDTIRLAYAAVIALAVFNLYMMGRSRS